MGKRSKRRKQLEAVRPKVEESRTPAGAGPGSRGTLIPAKRELMAVLWIAAAVLLCYASTLDNDFIHDDKVEILNNNYVKDLSHIPEILSSPAWAFGNTKGPKGGSNYYRPVQYLSYAILHKLFGPSAWGFHLAKLIGHLAVCLLFFWIVHTHWNDYWLALLSSTLYAVHPANSEAVSWISGITDVSCAFFFLLCWHFFLRYRAERSPASWAGLQLSFFLGLFCKEFMVTLIPLFFFHEILQSRRFSMSHALKLYLPMSVAFFVYVGLRIRAIVGFTFEAQYIFGFLTGAQALLNQVVLFSGYLKTFFFPAWLNAFHTFHPVLKVSDHRFLLAVLIVGGFVALCWYLFLRLENQRRLLFLLGLVWFVLTLAPVLVFFRRIGENVFTERYFYLPALGMCLALSISLLWLHERFRRGAQVAIAAVLVLCSVRTLVRNQVWQDDLIFYEATVLASPGQGPLLTNLGYAYIERGRKQEALKTLEEAVALRPDIWQAYENLGRVYRELGRLDESIIAYQRAATLNPYNAALLSDQASVLAAQARFPQAIAAYRQALELEPRWEVYVNLARICAASRRFAEAQEAYEAAAKLNPLDARIFSGLGDLLFAQNRQADAIPFYQKAVALDPKDLRTWYNLADSCLFARKYGEALSAYETALSQDTKSPSRAQHGIETARSLQRQSAEPLEGRVQ